MSLITRCPACGTMFKVVADQLKVSQGWVRCGHCTGVFDASAYLLPDDAEALAPPVLTIDDAIALEPPVTSYPGPAGPPSENWPEDASADLMVLEQGTPVAGRWPLMAALVGQDDECADALRQASWKQVRSDYPYFEARPVQVEVRAELPPGRPELVHTASRDESGEELLHAAAFESVDADLAPIGVANEKIQEDVSFVRDARRKAFWRRSWVRASLGMMLVLLLAALALQWTVHEKDTVAAVQPRLAPLLQTLCASLGCEVRLPRHIGSVVVDSSSFNNLGPDVYRLSFSLRNTGAIPLAMPSLEITLTDTQDRALVRRVLAPGQYGSAVGALAAQSAQAGSFAMKVSDDGQAESAAALPSFPLRVAGYRILAFYP
ncbi:MAG: DUF3426 domain-containing protein [Polaromonas sp.]|nr:DUF3426 domain-containing protein [Polaromonas sp.]